jgi:hypothetical protein
MWRKPNGAKVFAMMTILCVVSEMLSDNACCQEEQADNTSLVLLGNEDRSVLDL